MQKNVIIESILIFESGEDSYFLDIFTGGLPYPEVIAGHINLLGFSLFSFLQQIVHVEYVVES